MSCLPAESSWCICFLYPSSSAFHIKTACCVKTFSKPLRSISFNWSNCLWLFQSPWALIVPAKVASKLSWIWNYKFMCCAWRALYMQSGKWNDVPLIYLGWLNLFFFNKAPASHQRKTVKCGPVAGGSRDECLTLVPSNWILVISLWAGQSCSKGCWRLVRYLEISIFGSSGLFWATEPLEENCSWNQMENEESVVLSVLWPPKETPSTGAFNKEDVRLNELLLSNSECKTSMLWWGDQRSHHWKHLSQICLVFYLSDNSPTGKGRSVAMNDDSMCHRYSVGKSKLLMWVLLTPSQKPLHKLNRLGGL